MQTRRQQGSHLAARQGRARAAPRFATGCAVALALLLGACSVAGVRQGTGGLPAADAARLSLIVAQTRSQFPELSGRAIPFEVRKAPEDAAKEEPELALRGHGVGVEPGLQSGERPRIAVALYLDKRAYARGYLEVTPPGQGVQRWKIVAFDQLGGPQKTFDFTYVLAGPGDQLRYLILLGGRFEEKDESFQGFEGTLIEPGPGNDLERWGRAYKLDFGYRFAVLPPHQRKVEQAVSLFRELERDIGRLDDLRGKIAAADGELTTLRNAEPKPEEADRRRQAMADAETRLDTLRTERAGLVETSEMRFVHYYELRQALSDEFLAYTQSNPYLWMDRAGRQAVYDKWKVVEFHHPRIDEMVSDFLTYKEQGGKVLSARSAAMAVITRNDNWSRDPSRSSEARPRK
jgi:hypothetical protein